MSDDKIKDLNDVETRTFLEEDEPSIPPSDVIAYNELRSCADLFRMYVDGILEIQPSYQREVVWKNPAQTRFIDSLIKQLPIPSMCFSYDYHLQKWQVIDGLQRMTSIINFLSGGTGKLSKLDDIDTQISGQPVKKFKNRDSPLYKYYRRVENLSLPINVLRCDLTKDSHTSYIFSIFHRLNSGGTKLNNQEIRNCIFSGPFNELLNDLNGNEDWLKINLMEKPYGYRFVKQELILRMFAFNEGLKSYDGHLAKFLNTYMKQNRMMSESALASKRAMFESAVRIISGKILVQPTKLGTSVLEGLLVGVASNLKNLRTKSSNELQSLYRQLLKSPEYLPTALLEGLARKERVTKRLQRARTIFSK
ncbi:MAG: DUF262 domain-containing protein [Pyrinomonadaceae bacterium]